MEVGNDMPKFSIIVPIYNVEAFLKECIESVLAQTFSDYELLLVDDGSPDRCGEICDEYALKDDRIRVIHKQNGGLSDARNAGLDQAIGEYILFFDSDDTIFPELLETTVAVMDEGNDLVSFHLQGMFVNSEEKATCHKTTRTYDLGLEDLRYKFIQRVLLPYEIGWEACTRVFRRSLIEEYELRFADNRKIFAEDLYFSLCYCAHASKIVSLDRILYNYRLRNDSIMGVQKRRNNIGRINELSKAVLEHYRQHDDCKILLKNFDLVHMQIVVQQFLNQLWTSGIDPIEFQKLTREMTEDWDFLEQHIKSAMRRQDLLQQLRSVERVLTLRSHADYLLGGSWVKLRVKCKLIRLFHPMIAFLDGKLSRN